MATHKQNIKVTAQGAEAAAGKLGKVDASIASMAKSALGFGAAYFGAMGMWRAMKSAIELAGVQEQAETRLSTALGYTSKALLTQASALQQVTTYGDEAIISAQALIAAFVDDEEQIKAATAATLDLAAAKGMDLNAAADLVSKTLGSSTNAMSRYGIEVEGAVGSTERLESLTSAIADKFGGQAAAAADTMAGATQRAANATGDAAEAVGRLLSPAVKGVSDLVKDAAEGITGVADALNDAIGRMNNFDKAFETVSLSAQNAQLAILETTLQSVKQAMAGYEAGNTMLVAGNRKGAAAYEWLVAKEIELNHQILVTTNRINELNGPVSTSTGIFLTFGESVDMVIGGARDLGIEMAAMKTNLAEYPVPPHETYEDFYKMIDEQSASAFELERERVDETVMAMWGAGVAEVDVAQWAANENARINAEKKKSDADYLAGKLRTISGLSGALGALNQAAKGSALVTKRLAQGEAIINTYAAANVALKSGPPPWNFIAMAATIAAGLANVANIEQQQFARGGDFVTQGPQSIMVGDNPGGRERVQVTPLSSPNFEGPQGGGITINFNAPVTDRTFVRDYIIPEIQRVAS